MLLGAVGIKITYIELLYLSVVLGTYKIKIRKVFAKTNVYARPFFYII